MNLREIRRRFCEESARYDLMTEDGYNQGADYYINSGQRLLDSSIEFPQSEATLLVSMAENQYTTSIQYARSIRNVSIIQADGRSSLTGLRPSEFRKYFPRLLSSVPTGVDPGFAVGNQAPGYNALDYNYYAFARASKQLFYTIMSPRPAPQIADPFNLSTLPHALATGADGLLWGESGSYLTLVLAPVLDRDTTLQVIGNFWSPWLARDYDTSFWSDSHPDILISAAKAILEDSYRNSEGFKDLMNGLQVRLRGIDHDSATQDAYSVEEDHTIQMEG